VYECVCLCVCLRVCVLVPVLPVRNGAHLPFRVHACMCVCVSALSRSAAVSGLNRFTLLVKTRQLPAVQATQPQAICLRTHTRTDDDCDASSSSSSSSICLCYRVIAGDKNHGF
jgi:hypothetical protein